jgi:virginiamycin B lyase
MRRRILNTGAGGVLALILLPLLGVVPAQAQAGQITEFKTPEAVGAGPVLGSDGDLYFATFTASGTGAIGRITPSGQITQFADPNTAEDNISLITLGPDGNIWFTDNGTASQGGELGRLTPAGQITMFTIPRFDGDRVLPQALAAGPDGNLWFTAFTAVTTRTLGPSLVGQVIPATGAVTEFATPTAGATPGGIGTGFPIGLAAGSDGNLWFTEINLPGIARVTPSGQITEFKTPEAVGAGPVLGSDGDLYFATFTASGTGAIGRITPSGQITQFADPNTAEDNISLITLGPDGNIWFTDNGTASQGGELGRLTPAGQITMFTIPRFDGDRVLPQALAAGPDGNLWFTAFTAVTTRTLGPSLVGQVIPATGAVTEFATPTAGATPGGIGTGFPIGLAADSDGNLWFTEINLPGIARVTTS